MTGDSRLASTGQEATMHDPDLLQHLYAVQDLVARAPQRTQIVCGTTMSAADGQSPSAHVVTLRATDAHGCIALCATLDEQEHRVGAATGEDYIATRRRWEFVTEGPATDLSRAFASWLLARGLALRSGALKVCTPLGVAYVTGDDGSVKAVARDVQLERPQEADEFGWPPFRRAPRRAA